MSYCQSCAALQRELAQERAARLAAERDGMLKAYEHVADNLTTGKFALRGLGIENGEQACMIARGVVYECRELVLNPPKKPDGEAPR